MKVIIWGTGTRGKRLYDILGENRVIAFIDNKRTKKEMSGKPVIDFNTYKQKYGKEIIVVSPLYEISIVNQLVKSNILHFLLLNGCPEQMVKNTDIERIKTFIFHSIRFSAVAIYGVSIYSLLVYEWIEEHGNQVYIIKDQPCKENISIVASRIKKYRIVERQEDLPKSVEKLLISIPSEKNIDSKMDKIDIFDFSIIFSDHWHPELKAFHNIHRNKRCFIVATGPSLKVKDLDCLLRHNDICISMNKIFYAFEETKWRPDYYIVSDIRVLCPCKQEIINLKAKAKFVTDYDTAFWKDCSHENIYGFHEHAYSSSALFFSEDISKGMHGGSTVTYFAIQLAAYMGFNEIYLLGVDHSGGTKVNAPERHFYGSKDTKTFDLKMDSDDLLYLERTYMTAERYSRTHDFRIYNATRGGNLEVFERKNFDELFEDE